MKLQAREQIFLGILFIGGVLIMGFFYGVEPQFKNFMKVNAERSAAETFNNELKTKQVSLQAERERLETYTSSDQNQTDKVVANINYGEGETLESKRRAMLDQILDIGQKINNNRLIAIQPLPRPTPPPPPPPPAPGEEPVEEAAPTLTIFDIIDQSPYDITMRGSYSNLNSFIEDIATTKTLIAIDQVEIEPEEKTGKSEFLDPTKPLKTKFTITTIIKKIEESPVVPGETPPEEEESLSITETEVPAE